MSFRTHNSVVQGIVDSGISAKIGVTLQGYDAKLANIAGLSLAGNGAKALVVNGAGDSITFSEQMLGSAAFLSTGTSAGNVPVLDGSGKLASSVLPAIKVGDVSVVADIDARDAIVGMVEGDIAIVSSESKTYVYDGTAWQEMLAPSAAGSVTSVNGQTGAVSLSANDLSDVVVSSPAAGQVLRFNGTNFVNAVVDYADLANKPTLFSGSYNDLSDKPTLATVATSGSYNDLSDKPTMFSGDYADLVNAPELATVATTGAYSDLSGLPTLFSGAYADLTGKPTLFSGSYNDLTDKPVLFSGAYADLTGKPTLSTVATSGSYTDLSDKPTLFSGSYNDLTDKPVLFSGDYADLINKPTLGTMAAEAKADYYTKSEVDTAISGVSGDSSVAKDVVVKTDSGNVTATSSNHIIIINKVIGEATSVTLPASPAVGKMVIVKDGKGDANVNSITIVGTIDGAVNASIDAAYESVTVVYNGTQWNII